MPFKHLANLYAQNDFLISKITESMPIQCKEGCDHCCYLLVMSTVPEAIAALIYAERQGLDRSHLSDLIGDQVGLLMQEEKGMTIEAWGRASYPCPFLKDRRCQIYEYRPLVCRNHLILSNPDLCQATRPGEITAVDLKEICSGLMGVHMPLIAQKLGLEAMGYAPWPVALLIAGAFLGGGAQLANTVLRDLGLVPDTAACIRWLSLLDPEDLAQAKAMLNEAGIEVGF